MRILQFDVKQQRIMKKVGCDFSGLRAGSVNYLKAKFYFTREWKRCNTKVASFWIETKTDEGIILKEHAEFLNPDNTCVIPPEALVGDKFYVSVIGVDSTSNPLEPYRIGTNKSKVRQGVN